MAMSEQPESDGGLEYLEKKLGIFIQGPSQTRRNAALDILTGRVPDERIFGPEAGKPHPSPAPVPPAPTGIQKGFKDASATIFSAARRLPHDHR